MDQAPPATDLSPAALLARARALRPMLREAAPRIEAARELPPDVLAALHGAGLFRLTLPRAVGGAELDLASLARVIEAVAEADASCAWCLGQAAGCAMSAAYLPPEVAARLFGDPRAVLAWGAGANGSAEEAGDGWRISGRWRFASGARHATLLGALCPLAGRPGASRTFIFPREGVALIDDWQVIGLCGTGSDSYEIKDLHVPAACCFDRTRPAPHPAPLYRVPLVQVYPVAFGAVALGIARAMLDAFVALAAGKTPRAARPMRESGAIQSLIGQMASRLAAARAYLLETAGEIAAALADGAALAGAQSLAIRMASTHAIQESLAVVDAAYHEAGATAIFESAPFERRLRDMHAVAQQIQGRRANFELVGQRLLGMEAELFA